MLYYASILLTIISNVVYHIAQKLTSSTINPLFSLAVTYLTALAVCVLLMPFYPGGVDLGTSLKQLSWPTFVLGLAVVGLELGFLLAYRAGWEISLAGIVSNATVAMLLVPIGLWLFREHITPANLLGIAFCVLGLVLINVR